MTPVSNATRAVAHLQPALRVALSADIDQSLRYRGEHDRIGGRWYRWRELIRLCLVTDAFLAQCLYRIRTSLAVRGVPVLPLLLHRASMMLAQVCIGDPVVIGPGLYIAHGQVVVDGFVRIGSSTVLFPWITIGLRAGNWNGPTLGDRVTVGTGARVIGPVAIGNGATIGANAVVVTDVPSGTTVVGAPAEPVRHRGRNNESGAEGN